MITRFGDAASKERYEHEVATAKATQRVLFAVAPKQRLVTSRKTFGAGAEVRPEDLDVAPGLTALVVMRRLIGDGTIIQADQLPREVKAPVGVVAGREGLPCKNGILAPGDDVAKDDFDSETLSRLVASGRVVLS